MRNDIHVVVDSIAIAGETALKDDPRCHVLRLIARHGDEEWLDGDRSLAEMFAMVEKTDKLPGTSQPPIGTILSTFEELAREGKQLLVLCVDSVLSGTYQTCCLAARQVMDNIKGADIRVVDSKTAAGRSLDELEGMAEDMVRRTETYFSVNTLDYLQKGGRIGAVSALVGGILGIRPIIHLDKEGRLEIADKCRTRKKVLKRMLELAAEEAPLEAIFVAHAEAREDAEFLKQQMQELFPNLPIMLTGIGTVLAAHLGPGVIGLFVRRKP
jgi:fatty acid-binding protein DegV